MIPKPLMKTIAIEIRSALHKSNKPSTHKKKRTNKQRNKIREDKNRRKKTQSSSQHPRRPRPPCDMGQSSNTCRIYTAKEMEAER